MRCQANKNAFALSSNIPSVINGLQIALPIRMAYQETELRSTYSHDENGPTLDSCWEITLLLNFLINSLKICSWLNA